VLPAVTAAYAGIPALRHKRLEREGERFDWFVQLSLGMDEGMLRARDLVAVLLVALICGCGGGSSASRDQRGRQESSVARQVRTTVEGWLESLETSKNRGDNARACSYLTHALQQSITQQLRMRGEHGTCRTYAAKWTGRSNPPGRDGAHVTAITVTGAKATATLRAPPDRESDVQLERVGSRWLINNY